MERCSAYITARPAFLAGCEILVADSTSARIVLIQTGPYRPFVRLKIEVSFASQESPFPPNVGLPANATAWEYWLVTYDGSLTKAKTS